MSAFKNIAVQSAIALGVVFTTFAVSAQDKATDTTYQKAKQAGSPAAKIAASLYEKPMNEASVKDAKRALMALPTEQVSEARRVYHDIANDERDLAMKVGQSLAWGDGRFSINDIKSPEIKAALTGLQQQLARDKASGDKTAPITRVEQAVAQIKADSHTREDSFKTVVTETIKEMRANHREDLKKKGEIREP